MAKKMLSLLLALMMLYSLAVPAWAEATQTETPAPEETTAPTEEPAPTETTVPEEDTAAPTEEQKAEEVPEVTEDQEVTETEEPVEETEDAESAEVVAAAADQTAASDEVKLYFSGDGIAYISYVVQEGPTYSGTFPSGASIRTDRFIYGVVKKGYALEAEGATAEPDTGFYGGGYYVDNAGEVTRIYRVSLNGSGPVTLTAVSATVEAPVPWEVTYEGPMEAYPADLRRYDFPGEFFYVELNPGYAASVNGGPLQSPTVKVEVGEDGKAVVKAEKLASGAKLAVSGDASALVDSTVFDINSGNRKTTYLLPGGTMTNGSCYILVKGDYSIAPDAEGGTVSFIDAISDGPGCDVYKSYYVQAQEDTVTVTVEKAEKPAGWLSLVPINDYSSQVKISNDSNFWFGGPFEGHIREFYGYISTPEREDIMTVTLEPNREGGSVMGFTLDVEGGSFREVDYPDSKVFLIEVNEGVKTVIAQVVLDSRLEVQAPGEPTADAPGLTDQAGTKKQLTEQANAMVEAALKGQTPTGVTKAEAEDIADAAAEGKTITTQLVAQVVEAPADAAAIETAAGDSAIVARYVNAEILVKADETLIGHITQTEEPVELAVTLSKEELDKGLIFFVVRSHGGKTDILPARLDGTTLLFSTDKFSSFGVAYTDDIAFAQVEPIPDQKWTGSEVKPSVKVTANGRELKEGTDYELKYENNVNASDKAKVIITGKAPYTGSQELNFKIVKAATANGPATGDQTPLALYGVLMTLSLAGLSLVLGRRRRAEK